MNKRKPPKLIKRPICQEILASWEAVSGEITASVPHLLSLSSAQVTYFRGGARVEVTQDQAVGNREGGKEEVFEGGTRAEFVQWAAEILITGLTIYGPGVNISSLRTMPRTLGTRASQ